MSHESITTQPEPRFLEAGTPEQEDDWSSLVVAVRESSNTLEHAMLSVWKDERIPQLIRDRAMLSVLGGYKELNVGTQSRAGLFSVMNLYTLHRLDPEFDDHAFDEWLYDAQTYQTANETPIIHEAHIFNWAVNLFDAEKIDERRLEEYLSLINVRNARPYFKNPQDDMDWGSSDRIAPVSNDFPVIAGALDVRASLPKASRFRQYALTMLHLWTARDDTNNTSLPAWLLSATEEQGEQVYKQLVSQLNHAPYIQWGDIKPGIDRYGIGVVIHKPEVHYQIQQLENIDDPSIKRQAASYILKLFAAHNQRESIPIEYLNSLQTVLSAEDIEEIAIFADIYADRLDEQDRREAESGRRKREEEEKRLQDPTYLAKLAADKRFDGLLELLRTR